MSLRSFYRVFTSNCSNRISGKLLSTITNGTSDCITWNGYQDKNLKPLHFADAGSRNNCQQKSDLASCATRWIRLIFDHSEVTIADHRNLVQLRSLHISLCESETTWHQALHYKSKGKLNAVLYQSQSLVLMIIQFTALRSLKIRQSYGFKCFIHAPYGSSSVK